MASLLVLKGNNPGQRIRLEADLMVMGRNPDCEIHIPNNAVSRQHAQINKIHENFYLEDLGSRNRTLLNGQELEVRKPIMLKDNDKIKICDWMFAFHNESTPSSIEIEEDDLESPSTVHASIAKMSQQQLLETQPSEKLRALLEISSALGRTLQEDTLLPLVSDILFETFRKADRCFVILRDEASEQLIPKVIKTRRPNTETSARFSKTLVRRVLESGESLLYDDAQSSGQMALSASIAEFRIRSVMCAPLINQDGNAFGLIQLDSQDRTRTFTKDDMNLLVAVANQAAVALENAKLHKIAVDLAVKQQDDEMARRVQRSFLPQRLPEITGYSFYAFYQAARNVGGDYYDFIPHTEERLGVLLGDVAGKGMPAALLMAKLSAEARFCMLAHPEISKAVGRLNEQLLQAGMMDRFVTLTACLLDPRRHTVTVVNAGHLSPQLYRRATNTLEPAISNKLTGFPLGMIEGTEYECNIVRLEPGDCIVIFTDGVTDSLNTENEPFGLEKVREAVLDNGASSTEPNTPQTVGKRVISSVQRHSLSQIQADDIALVCFGRLDEPTMYPAESGRIATATGPMTQTLKRVPGRDDE